MATVHPLPAPAAAQAPVQNPAQTPAQATAQPGPPDAKGANEIPGAQALAVAPPEEEQADAFMLSGPVALLPAELDVVVPVREFRVRHLLALKPGQLIESQWSSGEDVPLASGKVQLAWSEFEVIDSQLVVRVTRLA